MNPNVINIFSNDDLIKSIEIDHDVKNDNTNSFDELLHKVDSEKIFSEDKPNNISHEKTEVENKTSNNSNKNELNEKQESSVLNDTKDGNVKEVVAPKNKEDSAKDLTSNDSSGTKDKSETVNPNNKLKSSEVISAAKNVKQSINSDKTGNSESDRPIADSGKKIKNRSKSNISVDRQRVVNSLTEQLSNDQVNSKTKSNLDINSNQYSVKNESISNQNANVQQVGNILNNKIIGKNPNKAISNNIVSDGKPSKIKNLTQATKKLRSKVSSQNNFNLNKENSQIDGSLDKKSNLVKDTVSKNTNSISKGSQEVKSSENRSNQFQNDSVVKNFESINIKATESLKMQAVKLVPRITNVVVQYSETNGMQKLETKLDGGELGEINVKLFQEKADSKALIVVESETAKSILKNIVSTIKENLSQKGLSFESFEVEVDQGKNKDSNPRNNRSEKIDIVTDVHIEDSESAQTSNKRNFGYNSIEVVA
jgi:flagellar hook-length control protein FliK